MDWWTSLSGPLQIFYGIAAIGTAALTVLTVLRLTGLHDLTAGDLSAGEHPGGLSLLSISSLVALLVGLGWGGVITLRLEGSAALATVVGFGIGAVLLVGEYLLMRTLTSLRHSGTLDYGNAIGQIGRVYAPIPAARTAPGQVEVLCQGRLITASALQDGAEPLATGRSVRVVANQGTTLFVVPA